jgi:hypothetical protein
MGRILSMASLIWLFLTYSIFLFISNPEKIKYLAQEDGFFETAGALFFLVSSILFLILFFKNRETKKIICLNNVYFLLLGCAFLFAFLEEISWGQRIFNLATPESLQKINMQNEINIHNIDLFHGKTLDGERKSALGLLLNFDRIFSIFWFLYCCSLPALYRYNNKMKKVIAKFSLPMVPLIFGCFFILNYLLSKIIESIIGLDLHHALVEIKECNFAFLFFAISVFFIQMRQKHISDMESLSINP